MAKLDLLQEVKCFRFQLAQKLLDFRESVEDFVLCEVEQDLQLLGTAKLFEVQGSIMVKVE